MLEGKPANNKIVDGASRNLKRIWTGVKWKEARCLPPLTLVFKTFKLWLTTFPTFPPGLWLLPSLLFYPFFALLTISIFKTILPAISLSLCHVSVQYHSTTFPAWTCKEQDNFLCSLNSPICRWGFFFFLVPLLSLIFSFFSWAWIWHFISCVESACNIPHIVWSCTHFNTFQNLFSLSSMFTHWQKNILNFSIYLLNIFMNYWWLSP